MRLVPVRVWAIVILVAAAAGALPALRAWWRWRESNPIGRGAALAARVGCLSCHGPHGTRGLPDPKSGEGVPTWDGGMPMMYVNGVEEVREYILDGVSKRRAESPGATEKRANAAIRMPAYRTVLTARQVDDLIAYFLAASRMQPIVDPVVARGRELVVKFRCESCHGIGGSGGVANPGSFKGYIPGWLGDDFKDLVRDDSELRQWILDGGVERLAKDHLAVFFLTRQRLQMPAYRPALSADDAGAIAAYLGRLRKEREGHG